MLSTIITVPVLFYLFSVIGIPDTAAGIIAIFIGVVLGIVADYARHKVADDRRLFYRNTNKFMKSVDK